MKATELELQLTAILMWVAAIAAGVFWLIDNIVMGNYCLFLALYLDRVNAYWIERNLRLDLEYLLVKVHIFAKGGAK